jgi:hypothetical protein
MRVALINLSTNLVENLLEVPVDWQAPVGFISVPSDVADFGWKWDGTVLIAPPAGPPPPPPPKRPDLVALVAKLVAKGVLTPADLTSIQK